MRIDIMELVMRHAEHDSCMAWKGNQAPALPPKIPPWLFICRILRGILASCKVLTRIDGACCHSCHSQSSKSSQKHLRISHANSQCNVGARQYSDEPFIFFLKARVCHCHFTSPRHPVRAQSEHAESHAFTSMHHHGLSDCVRKSSNSLAPVVNVYADA